MDKVKMDLSPYASGAEQAIAQLLDAINHNVGQLVKMKITEAGGVAVIDSGGKVYAKEKYNSEEKTQREPWIDHSKPCPCGGRAIVVDVDCFPNIKAGFRYVIYECNKCGSTIATHHDCPKEPPETCNGGD